MSRCTLIVLLEVQRVLWGLKVQRGRCGAKRRMIKLRRSRHHHSSLLTPNFEKLYSVLMNDMMIKEIRPWPRTEPNSSARTAGQRL